MMPLTDLMHVFYFKTDNYINKQLEKGGLAFLSPEEALPPGTNRTKMVDEYV